MESGRGEIRTKLVMQMEASYLRDARRGWSEHEEHQLNTTTTDREVSTSASDQGGVLEW